MELAIAKNITISNLEGSATPMQQKMLEEWLSEPVHVELYFQWLEEWETGNPQFLPDTDLAHRTFIAKITARASNHQTGSRATLANERPPSRFWLKFAASLLLLLGLAGWFWRTEIRYRTYETAFGEIKNITLPDQSTVILNANSSLQVPRFGFGQRSREVYLHGEAEFSVKHTIDHQNFLVKTPDQLMIEVLGTEFVVYTRKRGTKVALRKGKVQLHSLMESGNQKMLAMKPGEVVTIDKKGIFRVENKSETKQQGKAWQQHSFSFETTSLQEIAYQIEEHFGVNVRINGPTLAQRSISGDYQAENAEELLNAIVLLLDVEVVTDENGLLIKE